MDRPIDRHYNFEDHTSTLFFDNEVGERYYMRGGICWPVMSLKDGVYDIRGFALVAGLNVKTQVTTIFEQYPFVTVDNIIEDGKITFRGLAPWLTTMWDRYYVDTYYWAMQEYEVVKKYRLDLMRSKIMAQVKAHMIELRWDDPQQANMVIWRLIKLKQLKIEAESSLLSALAKVDKLVLGEINPEVHALQCVTVGMDRFPYRKKDVQ